jgi:hypothetical protein
MHWHQLVFYHFSLLDVRHMSSCTSIGHTEYKKIQLHNFLPDGSTWAMGFVRFLVSLAARTKKWNGSQRVNNNNSTEVNCPSASPSPALQKSSCPQNPLSYIYIHLSRPPQCSKSSYFTRHWRSGIYIWRVVYEGRIPFGEKKLRFLKVQFAKCYF